MKINDKMPEKWKVPLIAKLLYLTGAVKLYHVGTSGNGVGWVEGICNKWHPISWLLVLIMIIPCAVMGEKISEVVPFSMSDYYKNNLKWVTWKEFV